VKSFTCAAPGRNLLSGTSAIIAKSEAKNILPFPSVSFSFGIGCCKKAGKDISVKLLSKELSKV